MNLLSRFLPNRSPDFSRQSPFSRFPQWSGTVPAGYVTNFLGQLTRVAFVKGWDLPGRMVERQETGAYPNLSEETFEWELMLAAVLEAREHFVMVEAGAGYGRWLVGAALAMRQAHPEIPISLIGIEPEPQHYEWLLQHLRDNGLSSGEHMMIHGAVDAHDGTAFLTMGDPAAWYGQFIVPTAEAPAVPEAQTTLRVPVYSVARLLAGHDRVDLLDMDIQGAEAGAVAAGIDAMTAKVKRAFVETHSAPIHTAVAGTFRAAGWQCLHCYGFVDGRAPSTDRTPYGPVEIEAGLQCWINPRALA